MADLDPRCGPGRVQVLRTGDALRRVGGETRALDLLGPAAHARREALRRADDRRDHLAAHALLRVLADEVAGESGTRLPAGARVAARCPRCGGTDHGRPELPGTGLHLSLSHAAGWVAAAVTAAPCGVDVEPLRALPPPDGVLVPAESAWLAGLPAEERPRGFLTLWTRKEAVVKTGTTTLDAVGRLDVRAGARLPGGVVVVDVPGPRDRAAALAVVPAREG